MNLPSLAGVQWLKTPALASVLDALGEAEGMTRIVGGAVRNALLDVPVRDIDLATKLAPDKVIARCDTAGLKVVPTGIEHGTVTVITQNTPFEVTTLRSDVETFGRHARVEFSDDWEADAARRDFTINALYCDRSGTIFDPVGGFADIETRTVRFIGDAGTRITEDYLRILRFFRFFAYYGHGRPDPDSIRACVRGKDGLAQLSAERVWMELKQLLSAPDPTRALLWMRTTDILRQIIPETVGTDLLPGLMACETDLTLAPDPLLRLLALLPGEPEKIDDLAKRLRLSRRERVRLTAFAEMPELAAALSDSELSRLLYWHGAGTVRDRLIMALAKARGDDDGEAAAKLARHLAQVDAWTPPVFPVAAKDLIALGLEPGPALGEAIKQLTDRWVESDFALSKNGLIAGLNKDS